MKVITHQQVEGVEPGTEITIDADKGAWLIANGYASVVAVTDAEAEAPKPAKRTAKRK